MYIFIYTYIYIYLYIYSYIYFYIFIHNVMSFLKTCSINRLSKLGVVRIVGTPYFLSFIIICVINILFI